jgi:exodeoxyribonuclease V alpha subunit
VIKMLTERVQIVLGSAGTGKTTTLKLLLSTLRKKGQEQYMLLAPTGKAVQRIRESVGSYIPPDCPERIQTIHKFAFRLETYYRDKLVRKTEAQVPSFVEQVPPLVVVDEMSMVDNHTFYLLLYHLRRLCTEEGAEFPHLILIGDTNQLGPIGCGEPLLSMIDSGLVPVHRLTQIQRQKEGGLMDFVNTVRDYAIPTSGKDCILLPVSHATLETRVKAWIDAHPAYRIGETAAIICPTNAMCETVSLVARNYVNPQVGVGTIRYATESYGFVRVGDKVIQIKNNYTENVFNGSVGRVLDIKHEQRSGDIMREYVVVEFPTGIRYYTKEDVYDELDLAFALTTHKSQGSEYVHVLFLLEHIPMFVSGNLIYTAVSRAQTSLTVLTWEGSLEQCRRVPRRRYVYLANFLAEQVETEEKECG